MEGHCLAERFQVVVIGDGMVTEMYKRLLFVNVGVRTESRSLYEISKRDNGHCSLFK
jgi:hypothetical protein